MARKTLCCAALLMAGAAFSGNLGSIAWNGVEVPQQTVRISSVPFCRVWPGHQRELSQTELARTVRFDVERPGVLDVRGDGLGAKFLRIRPLSLSGSVTTNADSVSVSVAAAGAFVLEFDGAPTLHAFADAPLGDEPEPAPGGRTIRFAAGEHSPGVVAPSSGDVVILDEGAVVHGGLQILNATNVTVFGRGVFDASGFERADPRIRAFHKAHGLPEVDTESACFAYSVHGSKDVAIRGVTFRDPPFWTLVIRNQSENVLVDGIKIVGNWRYNSDGIDVCASKNVTIRNSFIRTFDDCLIARGPYMAGEFAPVDGMTVSNCVLWADWGQAFKAQVQDFHGSTIRNVLLRDIRVASVQDSLAFLAVRYGSDLDVIRDVTIEDVEIDCAPQSQSRIQSKDGEAFSPRPKTWSTLLCLSSYTLGKNLDNQVNGPMEKPEFYHFIHENITVRNVRALGESRSFESQLLMTVPRHEMHGVTIDNVPAGTVTVSRPNGIKSRREIRAGEAFRYDSAQERDVAAYVWPAYQPDPRWAELGIFGAGKGEWQNVWEAVPKWDGHAQPLKPLWGYENEADPKVVEKKIDAAVSHGVNVFIYDWYWYGGHPFLEDALDRGFLGARNNGKMGFFVMWANHDVDSTWDNRVADKGSRGWLWRSDVDAEEFKVIARRWIDKYFKRPNYYRIGGRPVLMIYEVGTFVNRVGGIENAAKAIAFLREEAAKAGLHGVHLMACDYGLKTEWAKTLGIDSATMYNFVHWASPHGNPDYADWAARAARRFDAAGRDLGIAYFPHASAGWDNNPRFPREVKAAAVVGSTPQKFEDALRRAREWSEANTQPGMPKLVTVNSWNEWTEGSYLEPDAANGFGYLEAVRRVFGAK